MLLDVQDTLTIFHQTDRIRLLILDHWSSFVAFAQEHPPFESGIETVGLSLSSALL